MADLFHETPGLITFPSQLFLLPQFWMKYLHLITQFLSDIIYVEMKDTKEENIPYFGFQWHITNRCNLRCAHCYQDDYSGSNEPGFDNLKQIADEIIRTLAKWGKKGDIAITGGEPLLNKAIFPLINYLESSDEISFIDILSNGTLINESIVEQIQALKKLGCVQISLDGGSADIHDSIRGKGTFNKALEGIRLLIRHGIRVNIMFTLQRMNMESIGPLIDLAVAEDISALTIERFVPTGSGAHIRDKVLLPEEIERIFHYISERAAREVNKVGQTSISCSRPLWVLCSNKETSSDTGIPNDEAGGICSIGLDGLCILPDATVLACRRLPISIGNLKQDSIEKIWFQSDLLWEIRDKSKLKDKCLSCKLISMCSGCRAIAYAITGDYLASDPQCWK